MRSFILSLPVKFQILAVVLTTVLSAFLIANASSFFFDSQQLMANTDLISAVYQTMGTIYAILLTFTLWEIWQNYSNADAAVQNEANTLLNLVHVVETSPRWQINIRHVALNYLNLVINQEWTLLKSISNKFINGREYSNSITNELLKTVQKITPSGERETVIFDQTLTLLNKWLDARRSRLLIARGNTAKAIWPLLFTGAFILFLFHGLFVAKTLGIWIILLSGMSLVIGLTFYLIFTLDCPFSGAPRIDPEPFVLALNILKNNNN